MKSIFAKISSECFDTSALTHPAVGDTMSMTDSVQFTSSLSATRSIQCSLGVSELAMYDTSIMEVQPV